MIGRGLLFAALLAAEACAQSASPALPPGVLLGARIRERVKQQFAHVPQYTCLESLDRFRQVKGRPAKQVDTVRLEVLFAGDQEFFDYPGGRNFKESNPGKFVASGMIGNGVFASYLKSIFVDDLGLFQYRGEDVLDGRRVARFDFRVPSLQGYTTIDVPGARATAGVAGTFWADPASYDLIRLRINAVDIPPILQISRVTTDIDYALTRIGAAATLLPQSGGILMERESGEVSLDRLEFTHCRAYQAESTVSFEDGEAKPLAATILAAGSKAAPAEQSLPAGVTVTIALTTAVTDGSAVGDLIGGKIVGNIAGRGGAILVADGTPVRGRIRRLEQHPDLNGYFSVGLEFTDIEATPAPVRFFADFQNADPVPGFQREVVFRQETATPLRTPGSPAILLPGLDTTSSSQRREERFRQPELPGVGSFFMRGDHFSIPAGFRMVWKTREM